MKTAISIPDPVYNAAERLSRNLKVSRSKLYSVAIERYINQYEKRDVTARLDDVYAGQSGSLDMSLQEMQHRSIGSETW